MSRFRIRKKYSGPGHPWEMHRIREEAKLKIEYGIRRKKEIWKMQSILRNFRAQARKLIGLKTKQAEKEKALLFNRLKRLGIIKKENPTLDDVLALTIRDVMDRRLQTIVFKKKMANTIKQARQFIVHGHISIGDKVIRSPNHLTTVEEESQIRFSDGSPLGESHPEIQKILKKQEVKPVEQRKE